MKENNLLWTIGLVAALAGLVASAPRANATIFDLQTDWSDTANPNPPWTYLAGSLVLPSVTNWGGYGLGPT